MAPPLDLEATDASVDDAPVSKLTRLRVLTLAALGSIVTGYAAVAALLALVTAIAPLTNFSTTGVVVAALPAWLAAHQVPIALGGLELGMLPLLPTVAMMLIAARAAAGAAERLRLSGPRQAGQAVGALAVAHGVTGIAVALAVSSPELAVDPLAAFYYPALIAALAATVGVMRPCGLRTAVAARTDAVALAGIRAGAVAVVWLLAAGGALLSIALLTSVPTAKELFAVSAPGIGNGLGMALLSVGFVPNAVIAGVGFLAGPGFSMGIVVVSPLNFTGGPVPGLPLLAALPEEPAAWWPALLGLPLGVGVLVGRRLKNVAPEPLARVRAAAVAAGVVALVFVVLAGSGGGRVGMGPYDPVSLRAAAVSIALVAWIGIPAAIIAWLTGPRPIADTSPAPRDDPTRNAPEADDLNANDPEANDPEANDPETDDLKSDDREAEGPEGDRRKSDDPTRT
jgi:hypothetical protein